MAWRLDINFYVTLSLKLCLPSVSSLQVVRLQFMISVCLSVSRMKLFHQVPASPYYFRSHISCSVQITAFLVIVQSAACSVPAGWKTKFHTHTK
jgi:hypothetical protein